MKTTSRNAILCVLAAMTASVTNDAGAVVRVGNASRTYADAYNQVNATRAGVTTVTTGDAVDDAIANLPVRVANKTLARKIINGDSDVASIKQLSSCAEIYPNGEFAWDKPTVGIKRGQAAQCVATVELRAYNAAPGGGDLIVARANLASGDSTVCNISDFPADTYTDAAGSVTFPADKAPTRDDVIKIMNQEQKKGAGLKIAAGTIIGGVFGNMAGKNEVGSDSLLGGGKGKLTGTAAGAAAGAAIMAGNAYAGKVAGDMILSTGVNAAAGSVMGNIIAAGSNNQVLRIENCTLPDETKTTCLWGMLVETIAPNPDEVGFYNTTSRTAVLCKKSTDATGAEQYTDCNPRELLSIKLTQFPDKTVDKLEEKEFKNLENSHCINMENGTKTIQPGTNCPNSDSGDTYVPIASYELGGKRISALIADVKDKAFGLTSDDWADMSDAAKDKLYLRGSDGNARALSAEEKDKYSVTNFKPMYRDADDGGIIDLSNKARMKGTLIGAGAGGAMGAFTAYQGASSDIDERYVAAKREYEDSLSKFYCATGTRHLGQYNSTISIPVNLDE